MKKMVSFISALAMCAVMTAPMFSSAAEDDGTQEAQPTTKTVDENSIEEEAKSSVEVTKSVSSTYTVIIPDGSIDIADPKDISVSAQNVIIDDGQALTISVTSANEWKLMDTKEGSTASLTYTLTPNDASKALEGAGPAEILSVAAGEAWNSSVTENMTVAISGDATMSGTYKDTLTFTVAVGDATKQTEPTGQDDEQSNQGGEEQV